MLVVGWVTATVIRPAKGLCIIYSRNLPRCYGKNKNVDSTFNWRKLVALCCVLVYDVMFCSVILSYVSFCFVLLCCVVL